MRRYLLGRLAAFGGISPDRLAQAWREAMTWPHVLVAIHFLLWFIAMCMLFAALDPLLGPEPHA